MSSRANQRNNSLRSQLTFKFSNIEPIPCLLHFLSTNTTDFDDDFAANDMLYNVLCCEPEADTATFSGRANLLIKCRHPDKSPTQDDPLSQAAGGLVPFITLIMRTLTTPVLRQVYEYWSLEVLPRLLSNNLCCPRCLLTDPMCSPRSMGALIIFNWSAFSVKARKNPTTLPVFATDFFTWVGHFCPPSFGFPFFCSVFKCLFQPRLLQINSYTKS